MGRCHIAKALGLSSHGERLRQITFRLAPDLIRRLDAFARQLTAGAPGMTYSRTDAVRVLLEGGLKDAGLEPSSGRVSATPEE